MQRAPDTKPKPNLVSFTQCGGSSTMHHPLHVSADTRSYATRRDICSFAYFNAILERCVPTLARWLVSLAGKQQQQRSEATNRICGFGGSPRKRRRRSWRRLSRRPQPTTLSLINYFFLFWPPLSFFVGV